MDWTEKKREEAERTLRKWRGLSDLANAGGTVDQRVVEAISEDLNTSGAITILHDTAKGILARQSHDVSQHELDDFAASAQLLGLLDSTAQMGAWVFDGVVEELAFTPELERMAAILANARQAAMQSKDFAEVDRLKTAFIEAGLEVRMSKEGVELVPSAGFDLSKLEGLT